MKMIFVGENKNKSEIKQVLQIWHRIIDLAHFPLEAVKIT